MSRKRVVPLFVVLTRLLASPDLFAWCCSASAGDLRGLRVSQVLTLQLTPVISLYLDRRRHRGRSPTLPAQSSAAWPPRIAFTPRAG